MLVSTVVAAAGDVAEASLVSGAGVVTAADEASVEEAGADEAGADEASTDVAWAGELAASLVIGTEVVITTVEWAGQLVTSEPQEVTVIRVVAYTVSVSGAASDVAASVTDAAAEVAGVEAPAALLDDPLEPQPLEARVIS